MIGKKTECPKCKYKFVVPEPPDADGDAPKKGKKAAKKSNKTLIYAGAGVGALAVVLLVVAGMFLVGGDDKPVNNSTNSPTAAKPTTTTSPTNPAVGGTPETPNGGATGPAPATTAKANPNLKDVTNLLPNETTAVYRVNFDRLNSHATPLANAVFDTKIKDLFRNSMTFGVDNLATYIHCVVGPDRDTFGVFRTKTAFDEAAFLVSLKDGKLPNGVKRGREMFLLKSNGFVDAISQAFATRTLTKMVGLELPPLSQADRDAAAKKQYGVCVLDSQTLVLGELVTLERYLDDLSDSGFPPFKSEMTTEQPPPAPAPAATPGGPGTMTPGGPGRPMSAVDGASPGVTRMQAPTAPPMVPGPPAVPGTPMPYPGGSAGGAGGAGKPGPQRRLFTTVPTYRTIDPPLKKMLNSLEENEADPPAVVYAEKLDQRVFNSRQFQQLYPQTGSSAAALLARVQMVGGVVNQVTQEKGNVEVVLEFVSDDDAKKTVTEAILPGLKVVTPLIDIALGTRTVVRDNTASGQGGNPSGAPGSEGGSIPPGTPYPGGTSGSPGPYPGGTSASPGSPGSGSPYPGSPGGNPADPAGGLPNSGLVEISLVDRLLTISGTIKWPEEKYRTQIAPQITRVSSMMKGRMSVLTGEIEWHRLAAVSAKLQDGKKPYPRGTLDREASDTRYRLAYPPEQRCSFFVDLLPYIGQGPLRNQIQDKKFPWYAKENINAGEAWVPEFLVPYYPQETWRATHPLAPGKSLGATNYVAPAGLGMDAGYYDPTDPELAKKVGITGYSWGSKPEEVKDGLSNTIYLLQAAPGTARPWVAGGGATNVGIDESNPMAAFTHRLPDGKRGTYALMADGSVRFLKEGTDPKLFMAMVTRAGGESLTDFDKNAPKVEPTKALDTELRSGAVAGKPLPVKDAEVSLDDLKPFQGTWKVTFTKSQKLKGPAKEAMDQAHLEVTFDGNLIRLKVSNVPGKEPVTLPPREVTKIDTLAKTFDERGPDGKAELSVYEFTTPDRLKVRTSSKSRPSKVTVPDDKSEDDYVELERVK